MGERKRKLDVFSADAPAGTNGVATVNPYTGRPYSQKYHDILQKRKGVDRPPCYAVLTAISGVPAFII